MLLFMRSCMHILVPNYSSKSLRNDPDEICFSLPYQTEWYNNAISFQKDDESTEASDMLGVLLIMKML